MVDNRCLLTSLVPNTRFSQECAKRFTQSHIFSFVITIAASSIAVFFNFVQNQSDDKSKNDSIKIVSRGHLPPAPAKGASRAAKLRAVARGDDTASTLKHEQQVSCDFFAIHFFQEVLISNEQIPSIFIQGKTSRFEVALFVCFMFQKKIQEMLKQIDEADQPQVVRLGDASIASPFTSKLSSVMAGEIDRSIKLIRQRFCKSRRGVHFLFPHTS